MPGSLRPASIDWSQGTPLATEFGDIYFSRAGGPEESRHVFVEQNDLPRRFAGLHSSSCFTIIETGFGTGLNWLVTQAQWQQSKAQGWLHYVSVEKFPLRPEDIEKAHACWPHFEALSQRLRDSYPPALPGFHRIVFPEWRSTLTLYLGDIADFLPALSANADAWFLDGFAPSRNAQMWSPALFTAMTSRSRRGCTAATFTAAGHVRRSLESAGFTVQKAPGYGSKREMLRAQFTGENTRDRSAPAVVRRRDAKPWLRRPSACHPEKSACVIGAGVVGACTARALAIRGWRVEVLEQMHPASGASGNPAAVIYPTLHPDGDATHHFGQQAWLHAISDFRRLDATDTPWHPCGILQLVTGNQASSARRIAAGSWPEGLLEALAAPEASARAGIAIHHEAIWYPQAGWLEPARFSRHLLATPGITVHTPRQAVRLEPAATGWRVLDDAQEFLDCAVVIVANAGAANGFSQLSQLPLRPVRGQISLAPASPASAALAAIICHDGYLTPRLADGRHCLGATFQPDDTDVAIRQDDQRENRRLLQDVLPDVADSLGSDEDWLARASLRCQSPDYLPLVGPVADHDRFMQCYAGLRHGRVMDYPELPALPGLYVNLAHGSKGFSQAGLAAEILAAELNDEPFPVANTVLDALHPMRFWARQLRRQK